MPHQKQQLHTEEGHYSHMTLDEYVKFMGGTRPLSRVLIANNGIAAVKAIRSIRKWAYETFCNDKMIQFVVMATPEDLRANAEYIHLADEFVPVPGGSNNNNYANIRLITEIAENTNCHAVWAGWGHASENPKLPDLLAQTKSKVVWIGPPSHAMRALGDKIGSTLIAQSAGVPCIPWSGDGLQVDYKKSGIPDDVYTQSCVESVESAQLHADRIGYPVMIKASEGGGGKGIRRVECQADLAFAYRQVQGEVPGSPIFIMKLAGQCRHLEVQLLCDSWGHSIAVFGRDCSIQRRHQKIIEEGPVVAAPPDVWEQMEKSAVRLAKEVGYVGAGTVEYLYMEDGTYSFLELNPRLQVEHPVTELVSGVNLPAAQLQIAMGIPLQRLPGIRRMYGESVLTKTEIDFDTRKAQTLPHHVIACRITAENPDEKFQPTSGVIQELNFRSTPDVWGYFSVSAKGLVHEFADSQFGHMFAVGATREIARKNMVLALKELEIRGDIRTTIEYLRVMIEHEDFKKNNISTMWLEGILANHTIAAEQPTQYLATVCGALFRAHQYCQQQENDYTATLLKGHLPSSKVYNQLLSYDGDLIYQDVKYKFTVNKSGPTTYDLTLLTPKKAVAASVPAIKDKSSSVDGIDGKDTSGVSGAVSPTAGGNVTNTGSNGASNELNSTSTSSTAPIVWQKTLIASCDIHNLSDGGFLVLLNGKKHVIHGREFPSGLRLTVDTMTCLFQHEYDPTVLRSDTQGKLVQYVVENGQHVNKGDAVVELEVMKMYVTVRAPEAGIIFHTKSAGTVVEAGDILANFRLDNPEMVKKATLFDGEFAESRYVLENYTAPATNNLYQHFRFFDLRLRRLLSGFIVDGGVVSETINNLLAVLQDPTLPAMQFAELSSNAAGRIPGPLLDALVAEIELYQAQVNAYNTAVQQRNNQQMLLLQQSTSPLLLSSKMSPEMSAAVVAAATAAAAGNTNNNHNIKQPELPITKLMQLVSDFLSPENVAKNNINATAVTSALETYGITQFLAHYKDGVAVHNIQTLFSYIYEFLNVEESFQLPLDISQTTIPSLEDVLHHLRKVHKDNLSHVSTLARAHYQFKPRALFISQLLDTLLQAYATNLNSPLVLKTINNRDITLRDEWINVLHRLASIQAKDAIVVSLKARQALVSLRLPSQKTRLYTTMKILQSALEKKLVLMSGVAGRNITNAGGVPKTVNEDKILSPTMSTSSDLQNLSLTTDATTQTTPVAPELQNNTSETEEQKAMTLNIISDLIDQSQPIDDVILHFLTHPSDEIRSLAAEAYIRRAFQHFALTKLETLNRPTLKQLAGDSLDDEAQASSIFGLPPSLVCKWEFYMEQKGTQVNAASSSRNNTTNNTNTNDEISKSTESLDSVMLSPTCVPNVNISGNAPSGATLTSNGMRRMDSLANLQNAATKLTNSRSVLSYAVDEEDAEESCDDDNENGNDDGITTPGGMCLQSPSQYISKEQKLAVEQQQQQQVLKPVRRMGVLAHFNNIEELRMSFSTVLSTFHSAPQNKHLPRNIRQNSSVHVLYIYLTAAHHSSVQSLSDDLQPIVTAYKNLLTQYKIRRITFICPLIKPNIPKALSTTMKQQQQYNSSMTPMFSSTAVNTTPSTSSSSLMAQLSLPTPLSLSKQFNASTTPSLNANAAPTTTTVVSEDKTATSTATTNNNTGVFDQDSSDEFLKQSVVVSPSYVTFRCTNVEEPSSLLLSGNDKQEQNNNGIVGTSSSIVVAQQQGGIVASTPMAKNLVSLAKPVEYVEDRAIRQIEPNNALHLQLDRLSNYDYQLIPTTNRMVHLFAAIPLQKEQQQQAQILKSQPRPGSAVAGSTANATVGNTNNTSTQQQQQNVVAKPATAAPSRAVYDGRRFFARVLVRRLNSVQRSKILNGKAVLESAHNEELDVTVPTTGTADAHPESEVAFVEALNSLEIALTTASALPPQSATSSSTTTTSAAAQQTASNTPATGSTTTSTTTPSASTSSSSPSDILRRAGGNGKWMYNHIFVNVLVDISVESQLQEEKLKENKAQGKVASINGNILPDETLVNIEYVDSIIRSLTRRYADKIRRLHVTNVEFAITVRVQSPTTGEVNSVPIRFICENPSSLVLHIAPFYEHYDITTNKVLLIPIVTRSSTNLTFEKFKSMIFKTSPEDLINAQPYLIKSKPATALPPGLLMAKKENAELLEKLVDNNNASSYLALVHGYTDADAAYATTFPYMKQRLSATALETVWCYDFMEIFEKAIRRSWRTTLLSYVNILADIAFIQSPSSSNGTTNNVKEMKYTKKDQNTIMTLLLTVLSIMFNYTDITLESAATSLRALIQAPLNVFKSAGIALIVANQLNNVNKKETIMTSLQTMVNDGVLQINDIKCIEMIASLLPQLPTDILRMAGEFAQLAIRIPSTFITYNELILKLNPNYSPNNNTTDNVVNDKLQNGYHSYSSKYILERQDDNRAPGLNQKCAMVAWDVTMYTPECCQYDINLEVQDVIGKNNSRDMILIANDITLDAGSFGIDENILFDLASQRARQYGVPRIYLSANSGARIGIADELKGKFKIGFLPGDSEYSKGFEYVYLTEKMYQELKNSVVCEKRTIKLQDGSDEDRYIITDVIGKQDGIHAECLRASGSIAGETSQAYQDIFTLTYVTCRSVGIGAYVARLSSRVIQKADPAMPLLLTGYQALNKLLGKTVYTSNVQLGGPDVMYTNGVSNLIVQNDLHGCVNIIQWLSYTPSRKLNYINYKQTLIQNIKNTNQKKYQPQCRSILAATIDPVTRAPTFTPTSRTHLYDPRHLLIGTTTNNPVLGLYQQFVTFKEKLSIMMGANNTSSIDDNNNSGNDLNNASTASAALDNDNGMMKVTPIATPALTGLFDRFSFFEVLSGWAKGIVAARARLGGIPVGVLTVDPRTIESTIPADPAVADSHEVIVSRAGQVLFPESSYKFAQAIFDMKNEDLPIVSLISFRGFSGGASDMHREILKYGSYIVDALHNYTQPIIMYLPPYATLRGGAWVVIDPTINFDFMEMYADNNATGGVLEPEGIVDVKFKREQILAEMRRCDPLLISYQQQLTIARASSPINSSQNNNMVTHIQTLIKTREQQLYPMYLQLAVHIADKHDTPVRMLKKGVINDIVSWDNARESFYWRVNAKQYEQEYVNIILAQLDSRLSSLFNNNNQKQQEYLINNVKPMSTDSYQHKVLEFILTTEYNVNLANINNTNNTTTTTTAASTIQLTRALLYSWIINDLPQFIANIGLNAILPKTIPSFNKDINDMTQNQDKIFAQFVTVNKNIMIDFITQQLTKLVALKTKYQLKQLLSVQFDGDKDALLEMLQ